MRCYMASRDHKKEVGNGRARIEAELTDFQLHTLNFSN